MRGFLMACLALAGCGTEALPSDGGGARAGDMALVFPEVDAAVTEADLAIRNDCLDGVRNGMETDVDCGGPVCAPCADRLHCQMKRDCLSTMCSAGVCVSCHDLIKDGDETDVDCGGPACKACPLGDHCKLARDCASKDCSNGTCSTPLTPGFGNGTNYPAGNYPTGVVTGDFDGDKAADFAISNSMDQTIGLYLGNGDGTFKAPYLIMLASQPASIVSADFDHDGVDDIAIGSDKAATVTVWLAGQHQTRTINWIRPADKLVTGDFDGDGNPDLAGFAFQQPLVSASGNGKGNFAAPMDSMILIGQSGSYGHLAAGDLDGDGRSDVVAPDDFDALHLALGAKAGGFKPLPPFKSPTFGNTALYAVAIGDFNGDGRRDVALGDALPSIHVLLGDGKGGLTEHVNQHVSEQHLQFAAVADFNRDGFDDVAFGCDTDHDVAVFTADGTGGFRAPLVLPIGQSVRGVAVADFDKDGKTDLVATSMDGKANLAVVFMNTSK